VIRLTAGHQAKVEEKPAVRKAGGVYYTPKYIVDYSVEHTVAGKSRAEARCNWPDCTTENSRSAFSTWLAEAGRSCGALTSAFLTTALQWYIEHNPGKYKKAVYKDLRDGQWRLTIGEKKRILTTHIFGVDIDAQAVEVTKLSLLLKVLEGETDQSISQQQRLFHDRALPNLSENIKCGNSLIGPDYFTGRLLEEPEEIEACQPFDWNQGFPDAMKAGGFDCVIGNPPYGAELSTGEVAYLRDAFTVSRTHPDTYALFIEQAIRLLAPKRPLSMIVPTGWYSGANSLALREYFARHTDPAAFVNLPMMSQSVG